MKNEKLVEKLSIIGQKIGENKYLQSISQGVMKVLPILIIGAFASLFAGLPIEAWQAVIKETGALGCLNAIVSATTNLLGLFFTYSISKTLAEKLGIKAGIVPLLSLVVYVGLLPLSATQEGVSFLAFDYLGTKGMIVGILISLLVCHLYKFITDKNVVIKMPQGTPQYVSDSFTSLIPAFIVVILTMCIRLLFAITPYNDAFNCIYSLLQIPLTVLIGGSLFANIIIAFLTQVNWFLGI
ncbi:MAG: PTS transporter subunit EIIC, partial [Coprobacillus sp.]